jgi:hypothetical protein
MWDDGSTLTYTSFGSTTQTQTCVYSVLHFVYHRYSKLIVFIFS